MILDEKDLPMTDGKWKKLLGLPEAWVSYLDGQRHNSLGPAMINVLGLKAWYINGKRHRLDGPATEYADGHKELWVNDVRVFRKDFPSAVISFLLGVDKETAKIVEQEIKK